LSGSGFQHSQNNFFDAWGKENKVLQLASAQEKPFCAILEITVFLAFLDRVELFNCIVTRSVPGGDLAAVR